MANIAIRGRTCHDHAAAFATVGAVWGSLAGGPYRLPVRASAPAARSILGEHAAGPAGRPDVLLSTPPTVGAATQRPGPHTSPAGTPAAPQLAAATGETPSPVAAVHQVRASW